ncbi:hypothetical protein Hdeb2414_s0016g00470981 [Helianthus debilis subsp. tardiflorus]
MEQNLPALVKKVWNLVRVVYFMLRKSISKRKILMDLNMMIKRGKIAGKALQNLMFNHHHHHYHHNWAAFSTNRRPHHLSSPSPPPSECEFSCTTSPVNTNYTLSPFSKKPVEHAVLKAMEMVNHSETASPALPGFGRSPVGRQLRVTDSPFPLGSVDEDNHVDEAAEQFISQFYNDLRRQNTKASFSSP